MDASESARRVGQVIFTRVEPEYSPRSREGYQVVWASPWLDPAVISEIESRARCFSPQPRRGPRLQFSALRAGGYFAARSEQVEVSRDVCDRFGRRPFLVQAGWFGDEALEKLDFSPFVVLDALSGVRRVEDLVDRFGQATGVATDLEVGGEGDLPARLDVEATEGSAALALTGEILSTARPFPASRFFLQGESGQVESALRMLWMFLPPALRKKCSFDTEIDGCFSRGTSYLLVAGLRLPPDVQLTLVDLSVRPAPPTTDEVCNVYLAWLSRALSSGRESVVATTETAYQVSRALCGRGFASNPDLLDRDTCREILQHEGERLRQVLAVTKRRRFGRRSSGEDSEAALSQQVQTAPEAIVARLARDGGHGRWRVRSLFRRLLRMRSDR